MQHVAEAWTYGSMALIQEFFSGVKGSSIIKRAVGGRSLLVLDDGSAITEWNRRIQPSVVSLSLTACI